MKRTIFTLPAFLLFFILSGCTNLGKENTYNGVDLYHTPSVSDTLAKSLGDYLMSSKFADGNSKTVQLTKAGDTFHFRMVIKSGSEKDTSLNKSFTVFASTLSSQVFSGAPVVLETCDDEMHTLKSFASQDWGKTKTFNSLQLLYTKSITSAQVDSLEAFLIATKFANGVAKTVQITKSGNTYQFRMVARKGVEKDPESIKNAKVYAGDISRGVFGGAPVEVQLCDDYLNTVVVVPMGDPTSKM